MHNTDILTQLRLEWRRYGRSSHAARTTERFRERHPDLALDGVVDLFDMVEALNVDGGRTVLARAAIIRALLEDADDELLRRTLLQTLLPGVVSACRQLRFGAGIIDEPSETLGVALALLTELLVDWSGQSRPYAAPDILSALRCRLRRFLLNEKQELTRTSWALRETDAVDEGSTLLTRLAGFSGGPHHRLASLTFARVFEGRSIRELARADHSAPVTLQRELQHFADHYLL